MSSTAQLRQSELFAGENWNVIYKAFSQVSLQAYDFDTIRQAMVAYIQRIAPESYNDWIESSEFIFIIDLLAYLGQSLAFRTDLNSRENFLDTAERRESILRLAKMLSYNPKRNYPARGVLKLSKIKTSQEVRDSNGTNLANIDVTWNDPTSTDWNERFTLILNSAFVNTNPFGLPVKQALINGVNSQLYQFNSVPLTTIADQFNTTVNGQGTRFEIVNPDFDSLGFFTERTPDPLAGKHLIYRNDGAGNASPNTGFFSYFKQGSLQFSDFQFTNPVENRVVDINVNNVNEIDVWVEEINDSGLVVATWTQVPTVENIAYNSVDRQERNIFSVITRDNDQISIRFGDGRFGRVPTGLYRVWYRTSNGLRYQIRSTDMQNIQVTVPYTISSDTSQQQYNLTLTFSLEYGINSRDVGASVPRETSDQIKQRANQVYYTQNRMVNGEDYNIYPLQYGNTARKVKAINRTYSGQSRYIDINDPTGRYQNTNFFGEDGILYRDFFNRNDFESLPTVKTALEIINSSVQPLLSEIDLRDFFLAEYPRQVVGIPTRWHQAAGNATTTTGVFESEIISGSGNYEQQAIGPGTTNNFSFLIEGALVKFTDPTDANNFMWASVTQVTGTGVDPNTDINGIGPVVLSEIVPDKWTVTLIIPSFRSTLNTVEVSDIEDQIINRVTFALRYNYIDAVWDIITANNIDLDSDFSLAHTGDNTNANLDASWMLLVQYLSAQGFWKFTTRNLRYVFESTNDARFYFVENFKVVDTERNLALRDFIRILKYNTQPSGTNGSYPLGHAYDFSLISPFVYADGYIEPRRVQISFSDVNSDGVPDNPDIFDVIVDPDATTPGASMTQRYVYHVATTDGDYEYMIPVTGIVTVMNFADITTSNVLANTTVYVINTKTFYTRQEDGVTLVDVTENYQASVGRDNINFQWKHYVPEDQRIDPSFTNIIDLYVLTETYYQTTQTWLGSLNKGDFPTPPTSDDLRMQFAELEKSKMISDEIVWHSADFKLLFGAEAAEELRAQFKVVKVAGTTLSDNEIKQKIIDAINQFFNVDNWSFGESFYYTELAAYIHQQLATVVASVVIVPNLSTSKFGTLFVIRAEPNQLFLSTATVSDVVITDSYTTGNIRIGN
jgi:hypothetical protein